MKHTGKGLGVSLSTTTINHFKAQFNAVPPPAPPVFKPLVVKPHPRQADIDAFNAIPSRYA